MTTDTSEPASDQPAATGQPHHLLDGGLVTIPLVVKIAIAAAIVVGAGLGVSRLFGEGIRSQRRKGYVDHATHSDYPGKGIRH